MDIINNAVAKVCGIEVNTDPNSREFMLEAFKAAPNIEDLDPWRTGQDVINDNLMRYTSLYSQIMDRLLEEHNASSI